MSRRDEALHNPFFDEAWSTIEAQVRRIAVENHAPINASRWLKRLLKSIESLELMPERHPLDEMQTNAHGVNVHRTVFEKRYLIFYTVDSKRSEVNIISFRHGAKEPG